MRSQLQTYFCPALCIQHKWMHGGSLTLEYYTEMKINKVPLHTTWVNFIRILLREKIRHERVYTMRFHLYEVRTGKSSHWSFGGVDTIGVVGAECWQFSSS